MQLKPQEKVLGQKLDLKARSPGSQHPGSLLPKRKVGAGHADPEGSPTQWPDPRIQIPCPSSPARAFPQPHSKPEPAHFAARHRWGLPELGGLQRVQRRFIKALHCVAAPAASTRQRVGLSGPGASNTVPGRLRRKCPRELGAG